MVAERITGLQHTLPQLMVYAENEAKYKQTRVLKAEGYPDPSKQRFARFNARRADDLVEVLKLVYEHGLGGAGASLCQEQD